MLEKENFNLKHEELEHFSTLQSLSNIKYLLSNKKKQKYENIGCKFCKHVYHDTCHLGGLFLQCKKIVTKTNYNNNIYIEYGTCYKLNKNFTCDQFEHSTIIERFMKNKVILISTLQILCYAIFCSLIFLFFL